MTGMVNRAKGLLGRKQAAAGPTPFTTRCLCGESIQGYRRADYQVLTCPHCSSSVFVLARNPLPPPEGLQRDEEPVSARSQPEPSKKNSSPAAATKTRARPRPAARPREPLGPKIAAAAQKLVPPRRWFTVPRMIFVGVVIFVALTTIWQVRSRHLRHLREELIPEARRGLQALADGDLAAAHEHLQFTVHAMDTLQEPVPDGAQYRQSFLELDAYDSLLDQSLQNTLFGGSSTPEYVSSTIRNRSIILDVEAEPNEDGVWQIHCLPFMDGEPVRIDASKLQIWDRYGFNSRTRVIIGVRLQQLEKDDDQQWVLHLVPGSAVLLTEIRIAEALGLAKDPIVAEVLAKQRELVNQSLTAEGA